MIYRFGSFELDTAAAELRASGQAVAMEPQVFRLLALLLENRERLVSKDEIVEKVWDGRAVSDSAVSSRVKSMRKAIGDDGKAQRLIKTLHGQGFRFVGEVRVERAAVMAAAAAAEPQRLAEAGAAGHSVRPSIAVLPLRMLGTPGPYAALAEALPHELIAELSRMRWLFVIARESSFRLRGSETDVREIGRLLSARYCLSGTLQIARGRLEMMVELADTADAHVLWAERFTITVDDVHEVRTQIGSRIVAALELQIPLHEAGLARTAAPENMDAWLAYHLGLQHMFRFNRADNAQAARLFTHAVAQDPGLARAHGGLSFVHFQTAFLRQTDDIAGEIAAARRHAERGLELDPLDPFVNFTMGRTYWLDGDLDMSLGWLERATAINPNYAHGIYARAWTESLAGEGTTSREHVDLAMNLSPLDPLYYGMLGTRAFSHMADGEDAQAAAWAERAARSPGAHVLIAMIAAAAHTLGGNEQRAAHWAANVRERNAALTREDFFRSFPMKADAMRERVSRALQRYGF